MSKEEINEWIKILNDWFHPYSTEQALSYYDYWIIWYNFREEQSHVYNYIKRERF